MSKFSYEEYSELGWHDTELEMKRQLVEQDDNFCQAMRVAIARGLERVQEKQPCS